MPQAPDGIGTLAGGTHALINPKASAAEIAAAVKWASFYKYRQFTDQDYAVSAAKADAADNNPVGVPGVPLVSNELQNQWLEWVEDQINIPRENYTDYIASVTPGNEKELDLNPEPSTGAQQIYAVQDTLIQTVLTEKGSDLAALLKDAQGQVQNAIDENAQDE